MIAIEHDGHWFVDLVKLVEELDGGLIRALHALCVVVDRGEFFRRDAFGTIGCLELLASPYTSGYGE